MSVQRRPAAKLVHAQLCFLLSADLQSESAQQFFCLNPPQALSSTGSFEKKWIGIQLFLLQKFSAFSDQKLLSCFRIFSNYHVWIMCSLALFQRETECPSSPRSTRESSKGRRPLSLPLLLAPSGYAGLFPFLFSILKLFRESWHRHAFRFQFERGFDAFADYLWESKNKGKLWKVNFGLEHFFLQTCETYLLQDIRHNYENKEEEEE